MNLQSDNKSSNAALQKLKQTTAETMQTITETPYQPIVYAIPKDDWKAMLEYLKATSEFQPTLYSKFRDLEKRILTKEDWNSLMHALNGWAKAVGTEVEEAARRSEERMQKILTESRELLSQDGKTREAFFSDLRQEMNGQIGETENLLTKMRKWILITLLANVGLMSVLGAVICLLMK